MRSDEYADSGAKQWKTSALSPRTLSIPPRTFTFVFLTNVKNYTRERERNEIMHKSVIKIMRVSIQLKMQ